MVQSIFSRSTDLLHSVDKVLTDVADAKNITPDEKKTLLLNTLQCLSSLSLVAQEGSEKLAVIDLAARGLRIMENNKLITRAEMVDILAASEFPDDSIGLILTKATQGNQKTAAPLKTPALTA